MQNGELTWKRTLGRPVELRHPTRRLDADLRQLTPAAISLDGRGPACSSASPTPAMTTCRSRSRRRRKASLSAPRAKKKTWCHPEQGRGVLGGEGSLCAELTIRE